MTVMYETVQGGPSCCPTWCRTRVCRYRSKVHRFAIHQQGIQECRSESHFLISDESEKLREGLEGGLPQAQLSRFPLISSALRQTLDRLADEILVCFCQYAR